MFDNRVRAVLDRIPPNKTILDIGATQNPEIHEALARMSKRAVAIDFNKQGIERFKKKGLEAYMMNAEGIKLTGTFDYIIAGELIEHLSNPGLFLDGLAKHLKKNGTIILTTPNISSLLLYTLVVACDKTQDPTHTFYFDKKNLDVLVSRHRLKITTTRYIPPEIKLHGKGIAFSLLFFLATCIANIGFLVNQRLFGSYLLVTLGHKK